MNTIKGKISNVVDAVTEKVSGGHDSVHTATKTPPAAPAGATHPVPGDRSINGATDHGSIKTVPPTVNGDKSAKERLEEKVKEPTPSKTLATPSQTRRTTSETVTPSTTAAKVKTAPVETVPVVAVEAPATAKAEAVLPAKAVKPVADATVPVTKFSEAEAYAVLPPAGALAGETKSTETHKHPVEPPSDGKKEVTFHLAMGGTGHKVAVKGSWDSWAEEVDCSADGGATLRLKPGTYQYKYIMDGSWINDASGNTVTDADGNVNNVLEV